MDYELFGPGKATVQCSHQMEEPNTIEKKLETVSDPVKIDIRRRDKTFPLTLTHHHQW